MIGINEHDFHKLDLNLLLVFTALLREPSLTRALSTALFTEKAFDSASSDLTFSFGMFNIGEVTLALGCSAPWRRSALHTSGIASSRPGQRGCATRCCVAFGALLRFRGQRRGNWEARRAWLSAHCHSWCQPLTSILSGMPAMKRTKFTSGSGTCSTVPACDRRHRLSRPLLTELDQVKRRKSAAWELGQASSIRQATEVDGAKAEANGQLDHFVFGPTVVAGKE